MAKVRKEEKGKKTLENVISLKYVNCKNENGVYACKL